MKEICRPMIAPSLLSADFASLKEEIKAVEKGGAKLLHLDVMDGHFAPNLTIGPCVVQSIRQVSNSLLDVHLMIEDPDKFIPQFVKAGADAISVHIEATKHIARTISLIRSFNKLAGVVLNPGTPLGLIDQIIEDLDFILIMTVNPGFSGQKFMANVLDKVETLRQLLAEAELDLIIEVDGGINAKNIVAAKEAGADWFVAGKAIFSEKDITAATKQLLNLVK